MTQYSGIVYGGTYDGEVVHAADHVIQIPEPLKVSKAGIFGEFGPRNWDYATYYYGQIAIADDTQSTGERRYGLWVQRGEKVNRVRAKRLTERAGAENARVTL